MTTDNSRYEEAADQYVKSLTHRYSSSPQLYLKKGFIAGASFAENVLKEGLNIIASDNKALYERLDAQEKEAHNAAIDKALDILKSDLDGHRHDAIQELEKLKI